jgi:hypothetical protein
MDMDMDTDVNIYIILGVLYHVCGIPRNSVLKIPRNSGKKETLYWYYIEEGIQEYK